MTFTASWVTETISSSVRLYYESRQRGLNVVRWTEMPQGDHFAAMEQPELLAKDLREFFRGLR